MPDARVRVYAYTYMYDCLVAQPPRRQPLCLLRPPGRQSVAAAAQRSYVLMSFCSYVSRVSGCQSPLRRQPLCLLRPPGRQSVAVRRAAALYVSYVNLCSYVPAVSGKHKRQIFCPYVLLFPALAATNPRYGVSPYVS